MAKRVCPKCAEFVDKKAGVCPFCGEILIKGQKTYLNSDNLKLVKQEIDDEQLVEKFDNEPDGDKTGNDDAFEKAVLSGEQESTKQNSKRHKHKPKISELPNVKKDENGEFDVDTSNIELFSGANANYSEKKARGEGEDEKIAWWEIYKWGQRYLERKEVNKEVKKAGVIEPEYISHTKLLILCLLFGWLGVHNFYAKNIKKGWFVLISLTIALIVMNIPAFVDKIDVFVTGGLGLIVVMMWIYDFFNILRRKYQFRESRLKFISKLNLKSRKKLGKKYENIRDWFVPYEKRLKFKGNARTSK